MNKKDKSPKELEGGHQAHPQEGRKKAKKPHHKKAKMPHLKKAKVPQLGVG